MCIRCPSNYPTKCCQNLILTQYTFKNKSIFRNQVNQVRSTMFMCLSKAHPTIHMRVYIILIMEKQNVLGITCYTITYCITKLHKRKIKITKYINTMKHELLSEILEFVCVLIEILQSITTLLFEI